MKTLRQVGVTLWGAFLCIVILGIGGGLLLASCTREMAIRSALDVASCAESAVANAAGPVLGEVSSIVLGSAPQSEAEEALRAIGVKAGVSAVLCAIDRLIADLGGPPPAHAGGALSSIQIAAMRALAVRRILAGPTP